MVKQYPVLKDPHELGDVDWRRMLDRLAAEYSQSQPPLLPDDVYSLHMTRRDAIDFLRWKQDGGCVPCSARVVEATRELWTWLSDAADWWSVAVNAALLFALFCVAYFLYSVCFSRPARAPPPSPRISSPRRR